MSAKENLRIRLDPEIKRELDETIKQKGLSQQIALERLIAWWLEQDELLQSMLVKTIGPASNSELVRIVCARLVEAEAKGEQDIQVYGSIPTRRARRGKKTGSEPTAG